MLVKNCAITMLCGIVLLSACAGREPQLLNLSSGSAGPDEFSVLPTKPLQTPASYRELPEPTPGRTNLSDPTPNADAVAALGGNPALVSRAGIPAADGALLAYVSRHGVQPGIRADLAAADLAHRRRSGALSLFRWFTKNRYFAAYRNQALDAYLEIARLRAAGVSTPSAPPRPHR